MINEEGIKAELEALHLMLDRAEDDSWEPRNELETTIVFACIAPFLGFRRLRSRTGGGFPDLDEVELSGLLADRFGKPHIAVELEYLSKGFRHHREDRLSECDLVVCWEHDCAYSGMFLFEATRHIKLLVLRDIAASISRGEAVSDLFRSPDADNRRYLSDRNEEVHRFVDARRGQYPRAATLFGIVDRELGHSFVHRATQDYISYYYPFSSEDWTWHLAFTVHFNSGGLRAYNRRTKRNVTIYTQDEARDFDPASLI